MYSYFSHTLYGCTLLWRYYSVCKFVYVSCKYIPVLLKVDKTTKCATFYNIVKGEIKRYMKLK